MNRTTRAALLSCMLLLLACEPNLDYNVHGYRQKIVVEGWIASNEHPRVYLTLNVPIWQEIDTVTVLDKIIRTAKVTVSDGENTEILTAGRDSYYIPYVYKGTEIVGEEGKTYHLTVEYGGYTITSQTTIPFGSDIISISSSLCSQGDSVGYALSMQVDVDSSHHTPFRVYTKRMSDKNYKSVPILYNKNLTLSGVQTFNLSPHKFDNALHSLGDTVLIKLCAIDSISANFFDAFTSNSSIASGETLGENKPLQSNISAPGFGIWWGNSARYARYIVMQ